MHDDLTAETKTTIWTGDCHLTIWVDPVSDAKCGWVGVDAIRDEAVENGSVLRNAFTGQQAHQVRVAVVELGVGSTQNKRNL